MPNYLVGCPLKIYLTQLWLLSTKVHFSIRQTQIPRWWSKRGVHLHYPYLQNFADLPELFTQNYLIMQDCCKILNTAWFCTYLPTPYSISWNIPEWRSTNTCRHSDRPHGSKIGITRVGRAVSMNAKQKLMLIIWNKFQAHYINT